MAGVSDGAINKIISGTTESPDVRTLIAIGKELNLSANWLLFGEGEMIISDNSVNSGQIIDQKLQVRDQYIKDLQQERDYWKAIALGGKLKGVSNKGRIVPKTNSQNDIIPSTSGLMQKEAQLAVA
ncbi:hypothetical protein GCM10028805_52410 [Spirosoma harenae]